MINILAIQHDLRNGKTIEETFQTHNTNLKEVWDVIHGYQQQQRIKPSKKQATPKRKVKPHKPHKPHIKIQDTTYIFERKGAYTIRKSINGKTRIFGTYNSLEDAQIVREELINIGWKQRSVDKICEKYGINRRCGSGHKVRYS